MKQFSKLLLIFLIFLSTMYSSSHIHVDDDIPSSDCDICIFNNAFIIPDNFNLLTELLIYSEKISFYSEVFYSKKPNVFRLRDPPLV